MVKGKIMRYLVDFKDDISKEQIQSYFVTNNCTVIKQFSVFDKTYLVETQVELQQNELLENLVLDEVGYIKPLNYAPINGDEFPKFEVNTTNDDDWWKVAVLSGLDFTQEIAYHDRRGAKATVYIVDSGIKIDHPEFEFADISNLYSMNGDFNDYNGHGTALASLVSGKSCGLTAAKLKSVKIFQQGFDTLQSHMLEALEAIYQDFVQIGKTMSFVNLSWTISKNLYIETKIRKLINSGLIVVVAAGNSGIAIADVTPASMPECVVVSAFDRNLEPCNFANYSSEITNTSDITNIGLVDLWSPGENIKIASLSNVYAYAAGTSISAAIHCGALAYNTDWFMLSNGSFPKDQVNKFVLNSLSATTKNVLSLSDKYSSSPNLISSYICVKDTENGTSWSKVNSYKGFVNHNNSNFAVHIFPILTTKNIVFKDPLPANLYMDNGYLVGTPINNGLKSIIFETIVEVTTHDNKIMHVPFTLGILPANLTVETLADDDPLLEMSLLEITCTETQPAVPISPLWQCEGSCLPLAPSACQQCGAPGTPTTAKDPATLECGCGFHTCN